MSEVSPSARNNSSEVRQLFFSLLSGVLVLLVEYWSGLFQSLPASAGFYSNTILISLSTLCLMGSIWFIGRCLVIWFKSYKFVREEYAVAAAFVLIFTVALTIFALFFQFMPWSVLEILISRFVGKPIVSYELRMSDFLAVVSLLTLITILVFQGYRLWGGLKSEKQVIAQERGDPPSLIFDAYLELKRILRREPPLNLYVEKILEYPTPVVDLSLKTSQWKDQALQLFLISSTVYSFDVSKAWHEPPGCWIGSNRVGGLVVLYPAQNEPEQNVVLTVLRYARQILDQSTYIRLEFVVLIKGGIAKNFKIDGQLIRIETEDNIIERLLNLDDYKETIRRRVEEDLLPESNLTLREVYVRPKVTTDDNLAIDLDNYLLRWMDDPSTKQLVLLGEYGQGKSTAALAFTYKLLFDSSQPLRIPLLIELRGTSPATNRSTLGVLGDWGAQYGLNPKLLNYMNETGKLLIIFEGFDEMSLLGDADLRQRHFSRLWSFTSLRSKVLLTGRPNLFRGKTEMEQALGLNRPFGDTFSCAAIRLSFFSIEQINDALRKYSQSMRDQIRLVSTQNIHFYDLVSRPSLLHIVAVLWEQADLAKKIERLNSAYVLDLFVRKSYRRPGRKDDPVSEHMVLNSAERAYFMHGIATYMASKRLENQIDSTQLDQLIDKLIYAMPSSVSESVPATSGETRIPLLKRFSRQEAIILPNRNQAIELNSNQREQIKTDVRTSGLLVDDPASPGHFRFPYKLFMEFLFAMIAANQYKPKVTYQSEEAKSIINITGATLSDILIPSMTACPDFFAELLISDELDNAHKAGLEQLDSEKQRDLFAKKLLLVLSKNDAFSPSIKKFMLLLTTLTLGAGTKGMLLLFLLIIFSGLPIAIASNTTSGTEIAPNMLVDVLERTLSVLRFKGFSLLPSFIIILIIEFSVIASPPPSRLRLWAKLCRGQNVSASTMHRILGTHLIVGKKNQTFNYWSGIEEDKRDVVSSTHTSIGT